VVGQGVIDMMVVGLGHMTLRLHGCRSLKEKRQVVKTVVHRLQEKFNVSVAEVGSNDIHQRAEIGFAAVGNDRILINSKIDKMFNFVEDMGLAEVLGTDMEILNI
jgi:uncharacterized protein YlxP (DUF503 family)